MTKDKKLFCIYISAVTLLILTLFEFVILPRHFEMLRNMALMGFAAKPNTILDDTSINSMGFTGDVISHEKNLGKIRILTLGGSAMFNRRMTERLKGSFGESVEVLGAALRTHTSMSSLIKYKALSEYSFDYVLIYHGINDLFVNHVKKKYFKNDYSHMIPWYKRNFLLEHSLVARMIYNNFIWGKRVFGMEKVWYIYPKKESENEMNFISEKLFRRNIEDLVNEIKSNGGVPVLMTFAWNIPPGYSNEAFLEGTVGYNNPTKYDQYPVELWGSVKYVSEGLRRHNEILRQIAGQHDILLIDQENMIGKDLRWFGDICHLSDEGTDKFVANIKGFIIDRDLIKNHWGLRHESGEAQATRSSQ